MLEQRYSDNEQSRRDIPSFIEPRPPLISNPFMRPRPAKGTNLLELFEEDSECEEPELVQVYLRLKPHHGPNNLYEVRSDRCLITSVDTATAGHGRRTQHNVSKMYTFSRIFGSDTTQKEIFENVVKDNLKKLPEGHSFTLLTYGASGSGKTFTLMGTVASPGLVPRSLEYVFRVVDAAQQPIYKPSDGGADKLGYYEQDSELQWVKKLRQVSAPLRDKYRRMSAGLCSDFTASTIDLSNRIRHYVWVSFVEIYNEGIYDLLSNDRRTASKLRIREDTNGNVYVKGATQAFVRTGEEAYDVLVAGKHNLQVAATGVHAQSSRSHCIFTITMLTETDEGVRRSCVRLCDLAGCERARRTHNTGARMQESRAINSSLHVLERCLHTLRRKQKQRQDAVVPYRESKLTRLLGAGLSGTRGEAVSMVVTLNPAPEYAHETKHVLQLAAVARDIQVNNTIAESSALESTQDTTMSSSVEVMKLRADNERLHFELIQAQARNKELMASMEERQQESANMMREIFEEAKDMTKQYYEAQMQALRTEMEDMVEEYESRLKNDASSPNCGTPSRSLQKKVTQLMTEIAILEEKLNAERLARARAEEEVQHLRACIEERDEKAYEEEMSKQEKKQEDVMSLSDSEHDESEEENEAYNESLEPTFKKEDINRSRLIMQSLNESHNTTISENTIENDNNDKSIDTLKDDSIEDSMDKDESIKESSNDISSKSNVNYQDVSSNLTSNAQSDSANDDDVSNSFTTDAQSNSANDDASNNLTIDVERSDVQDKTMDVQSSNSQDVSNNMIHVKNNSCRATYFVRDDKVQDEIKKASFTRGTYFINDKIESKSGHIKESESNKITITEPAEKIIEETGNKHTIVNMEANENIKSAEKTKSAITRIIQSVRQTSEGNSSLTQFEQLEMAANNCDETQQEDNEFANIKILNEKRNYFDDSPAANIEKDLKLSNAEVNQKESILNVQDNSKDTKLRLNKKSPMKLKEVKCPMKLRADNIEMDNKTKQLEIPDEQKSRFTVDQKSFEDLIKTSILKEKRTYFDNIDVNTESKPEKSDIVEDFNTHDAIRSPSIVKDQDQPTDNFEPDTIKRLLGESFTRQPDVPSVAIKVLKKHESVDIFESPQVKQLEILNVVEKTRKSIERMVLEQKSATKVQTIKRDDNPVFKEPYCIEPITEIVNITNSHTLGNNTTEDFENICKDLTTSRATEFELLIQDEKNAEKNTEIVKNITDHPKVNFNLEELDIETEECQETKYNLRRKASKSNKWKEFDFNEVVMESQAKCESNIKSKRSLRLRRRKNIDDETEDGAKLKDIVNLQKEFSDVTMDVPAPDKVTNDIPSPEDKGGENHPPGIQSCPSKSVTRSRRKLFTPQIEPLDEASPVGNSNERIYVPRPSYHRTRARRKL